jgi:hypothetical protein
MGELKHIAMGQRPEEEQSDIKQKVIIGALVAVILYLTYLLVLGRFELVPIIGRIRDGVLGSINKILDFFSTIIREIVFLFN